MLAALAYARSGARTNCAAIDPMDSFPDLSSPTDQELKALIKQLTESEREISRRHAGLSDRTGELSTEAGAISHQRRVLHGKVDLLRAELVNRHRKADDGQDNTGDSGGSGVREPRDPRPQTGAGGIALEIPDALDDHRPDPPPAAAR